MLDSEFWRNLAKEFGAIDPYLILRADWHSAIKVGQEPPTVAEWRIVAPDRFARSIRFEFEALARRGGMKVYPYMDSLTGWLEALRGYRLNTEDVSPAIETAPDGTTVARIYSGTITGIRQASVDLCKILESIALETERMAENQHESEERGIAASHPLPISSGRPGIIEKLYGPEIRARQEFRYQQELERLRGADLGEPSEALIAQRPAIDESESTLPILSQRRAEREALRDSYFSTSGEKIVILDMCWAAKQHYREWMRWLGGMLKDGTKPDRAFRAILTSRERPEEYRPGEPRPKGWK